MSIDTQHSTPDVEDSPAVENWHADEQSSDVAKSAAEKQAAAIAEQPKRKKSAKAQPIGSVCCNAPVSADGCTSCHSTATEPPTIDGKTFDELYSKAQPGEQFTYPGPYRNGRSIEALERHGHASVFTHGGIVAAAVRAGFHVLGASPQVTIQKPN
jgi:hypothetical protein